MSPPTTDASSTTTDAPPTGSSASTLESAGSSGAAGIPSVYLRRGRAWIVALVMVVLGLGLIGVLGEAERTASPLDTLPVGADSTTVVELSDQLPRNEGSATVIVWSADDGTLSQSQLSGVQQQLVQQLSTTATSGAEAGATGPPPGQASGQPGFAGPLQVSDDGTAAFGVLPVNAANASDNVDVVGDLRADLSENAPAGVSVQVTGPAAIQADLGAVFDGANFRLLGATATVVAVLLLVTYRSPVLWIVPLVAVGIADRLAVTVATYALNALGVAYDESTVGILSVLVFGAGTNYALLIISRYRDELKRLDDRYAAMRVAVVSAGEAVVASATTVVLGVLTLLLSVIPSTRGLGLSSAIGIGVAAGFALVVLPSILVLFGRWVFWPLVPRVGQAQLVDGRSFWRRIGDQVAARPRTLMVVVLVILGAGSVGLTQLERGLSATDQFLQKPEAIEAAERLGESFPAGTSNPLQIITRAQPDAVVEAVSSLDGVANAQVTAQGSGLAQVDVVLDAAPGTAGAETGVRQVRSATSDLDQTYVGGSEAEALDAKEAATRDQLLIMPLILVLVLVALFALLRSIVAPLILVSTVVGTFAAALGASWWLFTGVFGFPALGETVPLLSFLFLVALGVDYNIFLVTRAAEEAPQHGTRAGMLRALAATGGVITSAGILLAAVFAVLGVLPLVVLAQIGVVICIGVLLDTLLVRTVLVPSIALTLGDRFWWPRRLGRRRVPAVTTG